MKNKFKYFRNTTIILFMLVVSQIVIGQAPVATINYNATGLVPGSTISVPLTLTGTQVGNLSFVISYDRDILTYVDYTTTLPLGAVGNNFSYLGQLYLRAASVSASGVTYTNQTIFTFNFIYNGGSTNISFFNIATATNQTANWFTYIKANPYNIINLASVFNNGSASGEYDTLTSVTGGGNWSNPTTWQENYPSGLKKPTRACNVIITANEVVDTTTVSLGRCNNLTINNGGKLTLPFGKSLTVNGSFTIESGGSFVDQNQSSAFSATVKRAITGNYAGGGNPLPTTIWHYVSAPTSNATIGTFLGCLLNKWTENSAGGTWDTLCLPLTLPLEVGRGYSVAAYSNFGNAVFSGPLNTGNLTISGLTNSNPNPGTGNGYYGYHLLGNPYPSAFKWDNAIVLAPPQVDGAVYLWNGYNYISKTQAMGYQIQAEQGFFFHVNASGGSVTIPNGNRVHSDSSYLKSSIENQLTLTVNGNEYVDETSVIFNDQATPGFDGEYDAYKLFGIYNCPQIFSILSDNILSINTLPDMISQPVVQIGFKSGTTGSFTLNTSGIETFASGTDLYLTDLLTGKVQNLTSNPVYIFNSAPGNTEHRFDLHFAPVGMNETGNNVKLKIYSFDNNVFVNIQDDLQGSIIIYDLLGMEIVKKAIESKTLNKVEISSPGGYYLVKVITDKISATEKVFIR
ncbi:MAG: T9SS type A sorting domain-containing protein [Bacteroidota bacterium]